MSGSTWHVRDDPGLQPERTELAWQRTMISFVGAALLLMRWVDRFGGAVVAMVSIACVAAAYILVRARHRTRYVAPSFPDAPVPVAAFEVLVLTGLTLLLGVVGLGLVFTLTP
jgi:uncharacterized membrane protein YidH (DUF202 family)